MSGSYTSHSEYLPLDQIYIMPAAKAFRDEKKVVAEWRSLNYTSVPDIEKALVEYEGFQMTLADTGAELKYFDGDESLTLDSIYCRDASILTDFGAILSRMGKVDRRGEPPVHRKAFESAGIPVLGQIEAPGTLEGGDVAWLDEKTLAVGHGYRTNQSGIEQLKVLLTPHGIEVIEVHLPHFRGPSDVFHLMSILSPLDADLAAIYSPLMPVAFRNLLLERGFRFVEVPESEFDSLGCNILATGPGQCITVKGNPATERALRKAGCQVFSYAGNEISVKGGGGPTCLTRPVRRRL